MDAWLHDALRSRRCGAMGRGESGGRKLRYLGTARNQLWAELTAAAYSLMRMLRITV
jgi:hypothetical protein